MRIRALAVLCLCALVIMAGCEEEGSDSPVGTLTTSGQFKDSNIEGANYSVDGKSGVTGPNGTFEYDPGDNVTFSVGNIVIGTTAGQSVVTPVDLVPNGSTSQTRVSNIARYLIMLDLDGDPSNGITISDNVRATSNSWPQVNFDTTDLPAELAAYIGAINTADQTTHVLPSAAAATTHLEMTIYCTYSGLFRGTFSGDESGSIGVIADATTGYVTGFTYVDADSVLHTLEGITRITTDQLTQFSSGDLLDGPTVNGDFNGPNSISGTWLSDPRTGSFTASRVGGASSALYRFTATFNGDAYGLMTFDVDASGNVSGSALTMWAPDGTHNELISFTGGTVSGTTLNIVIMEGGQTAATLTGTMDRAAGTMSGTWSDSEGASGTFAGTGCKLN